MIRAYSVSKRAAKNKSRLRHVPKAAVPCEIEPEMAQKYSPGNPWQPQDQITPHVVVANQGHLA